MALLLWLWCAALAFAADGKKLEDPAGDEVISGPFSEYGEFDSSQDEAEDEKFFQYGRFFGLGLGTGFTSATGNAGKLYQGGFPTLGLKLDYWFDFSFALQVEVENSKHNYNVQPDGLTDVNLFRLLFQVKYYFDTRDLSAPITFIGPHLLFGGGMYQRTDNIGSGSGSSSTGNTTQTQSTFGFNAGGGLELTLKPKKTFLQFEGLIHFVQWADSFDPKFAASGIPNRSGNWLTGTIALMWTW